MRSAEFWQYFESNSAQPGNRGAFFAQAFEYLDRLSRPVGIVESACARESGAPDEDSASTLLFDQYTQYHPGSVVYTVDGDTAAVDRCRKQVSARVHLAHGDSVTIFKRLADAPPKNLPFVDLVYFHSAQGRSAEDPAGAWQLIKELLAIFPLIHPETLLLIDAGPQPTAGRARLAAQYLQQVGAERVFEGSLCGWTRLRGSVRAAVPPSAFLTAIITASSHGKYAVGIEDEFVGRSLRQTGANGADEIELAAAHVGAGDEVLIVGSHVGTVGIPLAPRCRHITLVEANPWTFKLLQCNLVLNEVRNATALHLAANDKKETLKFVMNTHNSGGSKRAPLVREHMYFYDNPATVEVPADSLDDRLGEREFALVFMDIEGSEYFALKGMQKILGKAGTLIVEFLPHLLTNVAGVSPEQLVALIAPHFSKLYIPSRKQSVERGDFAAVLRAMFDAGDADTGIVFTK